MKKLNKKVPIIGGAVIGVILVIYIILCFIASGNGFIKNMTINGIKVNNMSKDEVVSLLEKQYKKDQEYLLFNLKADGKKYQIDMTNNVTIDIDKEVSAIQKKYNNFFTKGYHYLLNHNENISINIKDKNRNNNIHNVSNGKLELDELEMILANDAAWLDSVILQRGSDIDRETVLEYLKMFIAEQKMKSSDKREIIDIQKHFRNWLNIKMNYRLKHERAESKRVNSGRRATEITATSPEDYDWPV